MTIPWRLAAVLLGGKPALFGVSSGTAAVATVTVAAVATGLVYWLLQQHWRRHTRAVLNQLTQPGATGPPPQFSGPGKKDMLELWRAVKQTVDRSAQSVEAAREKELELDAILASMVEGVIAVDRHHRILTINHAACEMFSAVSHNARGKQLLEVIRNAALGDLVEQVLREQAWHESEFHLFGETRRVLRGQATPLRSASGQMIGAVVVLDDITQIKQLENVRRDFVANVSHELKTPITSIKGYIETILEDAVEDPADQRRFLEIVAKQGDRLNAIIDDLLALAHVEQLADGAGIRLKQQPLAPVLREAVELSNAIAKKRRIRIHCSCDEELIAAINAPLLEQAITNLIDNACKYSAEDSEVHVTAQHENDSVEIAVTDQGAGIEARHLPRLFERFYRVDKSRSRKLGGTGLGLAIVKHIAQAHHGEVSVTSRPGQGSTFRIRLPLTAPRTDHHEP